MKSQPVESKDSSSSFNAEDKSVDKHINALPPISNPERDGLVQSKMEVDKEEKEEVDEEQERYKSMYTLYSVLVITIDFS